MAERGGTDRHQTAEAFRDRRHYAIIRSSDHHRTAAIVRDLSTHVESPGASDLHRADGSGSRGAQ